MPRGSLTPKTVAPRLKPPPTSNNTPSPHCLPPHCPQTERSHLDEQDLVDLTRAVLDSAHVRAKKGGEHTGPSPVDRG